MVEWLEQYPNETAAQKAVTYAGYFRKGIIPRWGSYRIIDVKAVAVERWLRSLSYANGSKAKARNIMSAVFNHAVRWEWLDVNPIRMVRQSQAEQGAHRAFHRADCSIA